MMQKMVGDIKGGGEIPIPESMNTFLLYQGGWRIVTRDTEGKIIVWKEIGRDYALRLISAHIAQQRDTERAERRKNS